MPPSGAATTTRRRLPSGTSHSRLMTHHQAFFSEDGEEWDGADSGFRPPGEPLTSWRHVQEMLAALEPCVIHVYSDQRHYFGHWMFEVAQEARRSTALFLG